MTRKRHFLFYTMFWLGFPNWGEKCCAQPLFIFEEISEDKALNVKSIIHYFIDERGTRILHGLRLEYRRNVGVLRQVEYRYGKPVKISVGPYFPSAGKLGK